MGLAVPGGHDRFVLATGRHAEAATLPPSAEGPADPDRLVALARGHGLEFMAPPLL